MENECSRLFDCKAEYSSNKGRPDHCPVRQTTSGGDLQTESEIGKRLIGILVVILTMTDDSQNPCVSAAALSLIYRSRSRVDSASTLDLIP